MSLFIITAVIFLATTFGYLLTHKKSPPLPPGPEKHFFLGNLFDLPSTYDWKTYGEWADKYGPIVSASTFGVTIVVINSYKKAIELMDQKSTIYSSRPRPTMPVKLMGWENAMAFTEYGPRLRSYRKTFHNELGNMASLRNYWSQEESHAKHFVKRVLESPENLFDHCFHRHAGAIILRVAYGYRAKDHDDEFIKAGNTAMQSFNEGCSPSRFMVNQLPILQYVPEWMPGAGFQRTARLWRPLYSIMVKTPFNFVKEQLAAGTAEDSFAGNWLKKHLSSEEEDIVMHAAGSMFGGGGETTAIAVHVYFLMMCLYPDVQKKAQAEMDPVVGKGRLPTFEDRDHLPYLEALTKEVMRYHPAVPNGLPHATTVDDIHDGYFIPKSSIVFSNIWKMSRDPEVYSDPETFNPGRFLGSNPEPDPREIVFGFGRRICPGRFLAEISLYITLAMCTATLDISAKIEDGKVVFPKYQPEGGPVSRLRPFGCIVSPRDPELITAVS
ncbi:cytochrome P450 [Dendrothele bispora CBS 962.96]|uniref:Cytochrome P450 n=1 Tax=Dendrothele bispora (strain CBS 962.96) TaxID=1314807 RepID=A0A4S8L2X4_DENBC|nr:cytochrome P450 [Dendrothele bispora CBS 962.96]